MQEFVPFEDDWDALESLWAQMLVPYQAGMPLLADTVAHQLPPSPQSLPPVSGADGALVPVVPAMEIGRSPSHRLTPAL